MKVRKWVIPVLMAAAGLLASCPGDILKNLDNPMDPKASSYQGYHTVEGADEVEAHTPTDGGSLVLQRFIISEALEAEAYHLQIAYSADFGNALYDGDSHTANIMLADAPLSLNTDYYWRGRAKQGGQWGKWTGGRKFTMTTIGGLNPANGSSTTDTTPTLSWTAVPGAASYELRIADSESGLTSVSSDIVTGTTHTPASALTDWQTYYWQVRAKDGAGQFGAWSAVQSLNVAAAPQDFVHVVGGTFQMGSTDSEADSDESPVHSVTVDSFYMAETEVTHEQFLEFLNDAGVSAAGQLNGNEVIDMDASDVAISHDGTKFSFAASGYADDIACPVIEVTWYGAVEYSNWLSEQEGLSKAYSISGTSVSWNQSANGYRLPTEAEWEYAARGGAQSNGYKYAGSNDVGEVGWYDGNSGSKTHPVKGKKANELGLYDMSGNVWEWCWDWYGSYSSSPASNPTGPSSGSGRVERGGSWYYSPEYLRVAIRNYYSPGDSHSGMGFRLVLRTN